MAFNEYLKREPLLNPDGSKLSLDQIQERIWQNKLNKGFNTTDPLREIAYLMGEFGEFAEGIRNPEREDILEAAVDMIIFVLGLFTLYKQTGSKHISLKLKLNTLRKYKLSKSGYPVKESNTSPSVDNFNIVTDLDDIDKQILTNKKNHHFNIDPSKIEQEFVTLGEELSELFVAFKKDKPEAIYDALADLYILLSGVIAMHGKGTYDLVTRKMNHNERREYYTTNKGEHLKLKED